MFESANKICENDNRKTDSLKDFSFLEEINKILYEYIELNEHF
jgi:hypothetical protein